MSIYKKLLAIQVKLKIPKSQYNAYGKYRYRSCEDILEALKPILQQENTTLYISDELILIGERYYIKATVALIDIETGETINNTAYAREEATKKGMDGSQITGAASSYARKYALNGMFSIDDTSDSDALPPSDSDALPPSDSDALPPSDSDALPPSDSDALPPNNTDPPAPLDQPLTEPQIEQLFTIAHEAGYTEEETKKSVYRSYQKEIKSLSKKEYDIVCKGFKQHPKKPPQPTQGKIIQAEKQKKIKQIYELGKRCGYSEAQVNQKITTDYKKNIFDITEQQIKEVTKWLQETVQAKEKQKDKTSLAK